RLLPKTFQTKQQRALSEATWITRRAEQSLLRAGGRHLAPPEGRPDGGPRVGRVGAPKGSQGLQVLACTPPVPFSPLLEAFVQKSAPIPFHFHLHFAVSGPGGLAEAPSLWALPRADDTAWSWGHHIIARPEQATGPPHTKHSGTETR